MSEYFGSVLVPVVPSLLFFKTSPLHCDNRSTLQSWAAYLLTAVTRSTQLPPFCYEYTIGNGRIRSWYLIAVFVELQFLFYV